MVVSGKIDAKNTRGQFAANLLMSALGQKRTFWGVAYYVRFAPESGHAERSLPEVAFQNESTLIRGEWVLAASTIGAAGELR